MNEYAGPVAGGCIAAVSAAMHEVDQNLQAVLDDLMGPVAVKVADHAHTAGIVFKNGVIKPLGGRQVEIFAGFKSFVKYHG